VHLSIYRQSHCSTVPGMFLKPGWRLFIFGLSPVLAIWSGVPSEPQRSNFLRTIDNPRLALSLSFAAHQHRGGETDPTAHGPWAPPMRGGGPAGGAAPVYHSLATLLGTWSQELRFRRPVENPTCLAFF